MLALNMCTSKLGLEINKAKISLTSSEIKLQEDWLVQVHLLQYGVTREE